MQDLLVKTAVYSMAHMSNAYQQTIGQSGSVDD